MRAVEFISGTLVRLGDDKAATYELVSIEDDGDRCWLRRSPQTRIGSAAFPVASSRVKALA
jgi:hypothetical protein